MNSTHSANDTLHTNVTERLSQWIHCICVVTFDLELGQAMEVTDQLIAFGETFIQVISIFFRTIGNLSTAY